MKKEHAEKQHPAVREVAIEGEYISAKEVALGVGVGALMVASGAFAVLDVTDVTDAITTAATAIATVGLAVLVMIVGAKVFKWVRKAL